MTPPLPINPSDSLSERFRSHMSNQIVFWERLEHYARRQKSCW